MSTGCRETGLITSRSIGSLDAGSAQGMVEAAGIPFHVDSCIHLHGGENSAAFDLFDARRDAHLVAKVYSERLRWKMAKEVLVYDYLLDAAVPTPRILFADDTGQVIDAHYALMTKLEGQPASVVTPTAAPDEVRALFRQIGAAAHACHTVAFDQFGYIGPTGLVDARASNVAYMSSQFERHLRTFRDAGGDAVLARAVERRIAADGALFANCDQAVLCHDDLHEENVLVERQDGQWVLTGVVDVENAIAADPLLDLAKADYYAREEPVRRSGLLQDFGPLPADGEARLALYRLHHALALWSWFAQIGRLRALPAITDDVARLARATGC